MSTRDVKRRKTATAAMPANGSNGHANGNGNGVKKSIKVAGASGGFTDRQRSIADLARCNVDFIVGDWMSECLLSPTISPFLYSKYSDNLGTMSWQGSAKADAVAAGISDADRIGQYDPSFMNTLAPALPIMAANGTKLAVNAGASDTEMLAKLVSSKVQELGLELKVAWVQGDEVLDVVNRLLKQGEKFENICFGGELKDWGFEPISAQ